MTQVSHIPAVNAYAPVQQPKYSTYPQIQSQPQQPNYNAVKIDIHNPSVTAGQPSQCSAPIYDYPQTPIYDYPQAPAYQYPQAPVYVPQQPVSPENPTIPVPQVPQPQVVEQQNINVPPQAQAADEPQETEAQKTEVQKPDVVPPQAVEPQVDLNAFIAKLANPDFDVQANTMEEIANMVKEQPEKATNFVDTKVFDALNNIVKLDTSSLQGPTPEQVAAREKILSGKDVTEAEKTLANTITPKEQAERNKSYALFTTAMLDKLYTDEVQKLSDSKKVPITELPGIVTVVEQLKDNPNPMVRASAIDALSYLQAPEYKQDLTTLFTVAQQDKDANVATAAKAALEKLNAIDAAPKDNNNADAVKNEKTEEKNPSAAA